MKISFYLSSGLPAKLRFNSTLLVLLLASASMPAFSKTRAETPKFTVLHSFGTVSDGAVPTKGLVQGSDGNIYGATAEGGTNDDGTIFKVTPAGRSAILYNFTDADGSKGPNGLILASDGNFYGTASFYGPLGLEAGTVFKLTPAGILTVLHRFGSASGEYQSNSDGYAPRANLIEGGDGNFYGTTEFGGTAGTGTVFKITSDGMLTTLCSFNSTDSTSETNGDGAAPKTSLLQGDDGNFYGITSVGGPYGEGTMFKITPAGALTTLYNFPDPPESLIKGNDGNFYGVSGGGGTYDQGTIFQITPAGVLTTLYNFTDGSDSAGPISLLQGSDGDFYGLTRYGETFTFFNLTPAGVLTTLYHFTADGNGEYYEAGLIKGSDGNFYVSTNGGGTSNNGTIFKLTSAGVQTPLHIFGGSGSDGKYPNALIQGDDGNFYSTTYEGGIADQGTVFQITPNGVLTILISFTAADTGGSNPKTGLIVGSDGNFYGTTSYATAATDDSIGDGTIFKLTTDGGFDSLYSFITSLSTGNNPTSLIQGVDGYLYGLTDAGGTNDAGTFFKVTQSGVLINLYNFSDPYANSNPPSPFRLIQGSDENFYGLSAFGGVNGAGTVFQITASGVLATIYSFPKADSKQINGDGQFPTCLTTGSDGNFYGTTNQGGSNGEGTIFKLTPKGVLTTLYNFPGPYTSPTSLIQGSDGNFYGTTGEGGINGTVFKFTPNGVLTTLHDFSSTDSNGNNIDGGYPNGLLQGSDGNLYGTTSAGGTDGDGVVFKVDLNATATPTGPVVTLAVLGNGESVEGGEAGKVKVVRTGDTSTPLTVRYKIAGSAQAGMDYKALSGTVTIPAGATQAKIKIKAIDDEVHQGTRIAKVKLKAATDGSYTLGTPAAAKVKIIDND